MCSCVALETLVTIDLNCFSLETNIVLGCIWERCLQIAFIQVTFCFLNKFIFSNNLEIQDGIMLRHPIMLWNPKETMLDSYELWHRFIVVALILSVLRRRYFLTPSPLPHSWRRKSKKKTLRINRVKLANCLLATAYHNLFSSSLSYHNIQRFFITCKILIDDK